MSDRDPVALAREAKTILESALFRAAMLGIVNRAHEQWESSGARDADRREQLWLKVQAVREVEKELRSVINSGNIRERELVEAEQARRGRPAEPRA